MSPNLQPHLFWLKVRTTGSRPSICVRTFNQFTIRLKERQVPVLLLVWDNASWHSSRAVRNGIAAHNRHVKQEQQGVRIVSCFLPSKSPWLNPIEPKWVHGKRAIIEPARLLTGQEVAERVCGYFGCVHEPHLSIPDQAA
jgi:hypothetical protein